jgi:hypothetical protein
MIHVVIISNAYFIFSYLTTADTQTDVTAILDARGRPSGKKISRQTFSILLI